MKNSVVFVCLFLFSACFARLPSTFKKCNRNQKNLNECLSKAVDDAVKQLNKPFKEIGLPSLEPLEIPSLTIGAGTSAVRLEQIYKNLKIYGFTKPESTKFEFDLDKRIARMDMTFPEVKLVADYDFNGKILLLPVFGTGPATVIMEKLNGAETFMLEEYDKKGKKFIKVSNSTLRLDPKSVKFNLENLFNGDKALGDNINKVLNENWKEVFEDVKTSYEDAFNQIISSLFNNVLAKVPLPELFDE